MDKTKSIVIGATGYIGRRILSDGRAGGEAIGTSSRPATGLLHLDLTRPADFDYSVISAGDAVFLTAANSSPDFCTQHYREAYAINVTGSGEVIERSLAAGAKVIFFSSDTVYGGSGASVDENARCEPAGEYAQMKREVEQRFAQHPHFKSLRLSYVFSRTDKFTQYLLSCAQSGKKAEIFHPFYRAVVHLEDVVQAALALAAGWNVVSSGVVNIGGPEVIARVDLAEIVKGAAPTLLFAVAPPPPGFFASRPAEIRMVSPILGTLLGRPARGIREAARFEFSGHH